MDPHEPPDTEYYIRDNEYCPICHAEMDWNDCEYCGGDGSWWDEDLADDMECEVCGGRGGSLYCGNRAAHPVPTPAGS